MAVETRRSALSVGDVEFELKEITKPHQLGIHLGIPPEDLERFEEDHPHNVTRQRTEVIKYWLRNFASATWNTLATAVEKVGGHMLLVTRLRELAQRSTNQDHDEVEEWDFQTPPESPTIATEEEDIFKHISSLPSLKTGTPVDSDDSMLAFATDKLKLEFSTLFTKVRLSLQKLQISAESVLSHLKSIEAIGPHFEAVYMSRSETFAGTVSKPLHSLEDLFPAIAPYCSWFNHLLVENIIETFCDDDDKLQRNWEGFKDKFAKYCEARLHKCPQDQFGEDHTPTHTTPIVMKIDHQWKTVKVKQLTVIRDAVSQVLEIKPYNLYLRAVQNGCVELLFHVPFSLAHRFIHPYVWQIAGLHQNGIIQIRCDRSLYIANALAEIGNSIEEEIYAQEKLFETESVPGFSDLVDIAQYLSDSALEAYKQYFKGQISSSARQLYGVGHRLRKLGDEFEIRLRIIQVAEHLRNLGDGFQAKLFAMMYVTQFLPIIASLMLYDYLPRPLNNVVVGASFTGSGFLLLRLWRNNHLIRGPSIHA